MTIQNQTTTAATSHSEVATIAFQIFTIAAVGLFSALLLLNAAAQIV